MGNVRSETDKTLSEAGQGRAERVLGQGYGGMVRIAGFVLVFLLVAGTAFYLLGS